MSEGQERLPPTPSEMVDAWRQTAAQMEQRWNEYLNQVMGSEPFAQAMARSMDTFLTLQAGYGRMMEQYLRVMNVPTRSDIVQLAERIGALEQQISDLSMTLGAGGPRFEEQPEAPVPITRVPRSRPRSRRSSAAPQGPEAGP